METKTRVYYLDIIKLIAVLGLCSLHFSWVGDIEFRPPMELVPALRRFFYGFYACTVPLFVMVNGALLLNRPLNLKKHYVNLVKIALQHVFWRGLSIILIGLYTGVDFSSWNLTRFVNVLLLLQDIDGVRINHLWFVPMLICLYVWFPLLKAAWDESEYSPYGIKLILPFMGMLLIFCFLVDDLMLFQPAVPLLKAAHLGGLRMFQPLSSALYSSMLFYFLLGGLLHKYSDRLKRLSTPLCLGAALLGMVLLYVEWHVHSGLMGATYDNIFSSHENLPDVLLSVAVFILVQRAETLLARREGLCRIAGRVSAESLSVYYIHWILLSTVYEYLHVADGFFFNILRSVLLCIICVELSRLMKKIPLLRALVH